MKGIDILLIVAVGVALGLAVRRIILDKKRGRRCCDGNCGSCGGCGK